MGLTEDARRHRRIFLLLLCAAAAVGLTIAALSFEPEDKAPGAARAAHAAVCDSLAAARSGDAAAARMVFVDRAHEGLHQLAADTADQDRAAAAELLEAKQEVESALTGPPRRLAIALDLLAPSVRRAMSVTDADTVPPSACAEEAEAP